MGAIIAFVITLIIAIVIHLRSYNFEYVIIWMIVAFIILFMPVQFIDFKTEGVKIDEIPIVSLKDNSNSEGEFFLGSGKVEDIDYYYYMTQTEKGLKMDKKETDSSYINEVDSEEYKVEIYELELKSKFVKFMFELILEEQYEYIFHIPKDSVDKSFNVDME